MEMLEQECDFCAEGSSGKIGQYYAHLIERPSRILLSLPSLYVIPTLSPIVVNHLLLVSRRHVTSRAQLNDFDKQAFTSTEGIIRDKLARPGSSVVTFEHGIGFGSHGGCGVSHCHVHMLPLHSQVAAKFLNSCLDMLGRDPAVNAADLLPRDSYLYIRNDDVADNHPQIVVRRGDYPSQLLRNLVEDAIGMSRTNWRELVRPAYLRQTLCAPEWT